MVEFGDLLLLKTMSSPVVRNTAEVIGAVLLLVNVVTAVQMCASPKVVVERDKSAYELLETDSARKAYKDSIRTIFRAISRAGQANRDSAQAGTAQAAEASEKTK